MWREIEVGVLTLGRRIGPSGGTQSGTGVILAVTLAIGLCVGLLVCVGRWESRRARGPRPLGPLARMAIGANARIQYVSIPSRVVTAREPIVVDVEIPDLPSVDTPQ